MFRKITKMLEQGKERIGYKAGHVRTEKRVIALELYSILKSEFEK